MSDQDYKLLLGFDTDDKEFCRGFEAGRIWEMLKTGEPFEQTIHATNSEMAIRMCEATGRQFSAEPFDDTWIDLRVEESES